MKNSAIDSIHVPRLALNERQQLCAVLPYTARLRATNDGTGQVPAWQEDAVYLPTRGSRVAPLLRIVPQVHPAPNVASETARTEVAVPTPYGTALPESAMSFTKAELPDRRIGAYMSVDKSVLEDSATLDLAVNFLLDVDVARAIDNQVLNGTGVGEAFTGLATSSLTAVPVSTGARWEAFVKAAATVRASDWTAPITTVIHPTDAKSLGLEKTATTNAPVLADALAALRLLDADNFVVSSLVVQGTAYTGSWAEAATLYVRQEAQIQASMDHANYYTLGEIALVCDTRLAFKLAFPSALTQVTGL